MLPRVFLSVFFSFFYYGIGGGVAVVARVPQDASFLLLLLLLLLLFLQFCLCLFLSSDVVFFLSFDSGPAMISFFLASVPGFSGRANRGDGQKTNDTAES